MIGTKLKLTKRSSRRHFFSPKKPVVVSGDVTFSMKWMQLHSAANATELAGSPVVIVTIFVYSCNNLVNVGFFWCLLMSWFVDVAGAVKHYKCLIQYDFKKPLRSATSLIF